MEEEIIVDEGCVKPDRSNEIDLKPLLETLKTQLNNHCEKLKRFLEAKAYALNEKQIEAQTYWIDFDPRDTTQLIDDTVYLVRNYYKNGSITSPHLAYWDAEEQHFRLLHCTTFMPPVVQQYLKIPK